MRFFFRPLNLNVNVHVAVNVITKVNIAHMKIKRKHSKQYDYNNNNQKKNTNINTNSNAITNGNNKRLSNRIAAHAKRKRNSVNNSNNSNDNNNNNNDRPTLMANKNNNNINGNKTKHKMMAIEPSTYHNNNRTIVHKSNYNSNSNANNNNNNVTSKIANAVRSVVADDVMTGNAHKPHHLALVPKNNINISSKTNAKMSSNNNNNNIGNKHKLNVKNRGNRSVLAIAHLLAVQRMPLLMLINTLCILYLTFCCPPVHCDMKMAAATLSSAFDDFDEIARVTIAANHATSTTTATPTTPTTTRTAPPSAAAAAAAAAATELTTKMLGNFTLDLITDECKRHCELEKNLFHDEFGIKCNDGSDDDNSEKCYKQRCCKGCDLWWHALQEFESCQEACSVSVFYPYDLPCISACEMGQHLHAYLQRLALTPLVAAIKPQLLTTPSSAASASASAQAPQAARTIADDERSDGETAEVLVVAATAEAIDVGVVDASGHVDDDSDGTGHGGDDDNNGVDGMLMANSLRLKWSITLPDNYFASRPFNIQYQLLNVTQNTTTAATADDQEQHWRYLADYNCNERFDCRLLDGLMPYTSYRFRFELVFGEGNNEVLHSPASDIYRTPAAGPPLSPPVIESAFAMDHEHISVFWSPGQYVSGPLKGYRLQLRAADKPNRTIEEFVPLSKQRHVFSDLSSNAQYTLHIAMVNDEGDGPNATTTVHTKELPQSLPSIEMLQGVLLANERSLKLLELESLEAQTLYDSPIELNDFAYHSAARRVYFTDNAGSLKCLNLGNVSVIDSIYFDVRDAGDFKPNKLTLDWLNHRLYMTGIEAGNGWSLMSSDLRGGDFRKLDRNLNGSVVQVDMDPLNGWLFYTTTTATTVDSDRNTESEANCLWHYNLADGRHTLILNSTQIGYFINDYQRFMLLVYNRSDGDLYEYSYDGTFRRRLTADVARLLQGNEVADGGGGLQSFSYQAGVLLATNGTQLAYENRQSGEAMLWPLDDILWCRRIWPLLQQGSFGQPQPTPVNAVPQQLQALLSAHVARITWAAPQRNAFQSASAWSQWEYELEIMDVVSNSAFNIRNIRTNYFNVEKLQANNLYTLRVRTTIGSDGVTLGGSEVLTSAWSNALSARTWPLGEHKFWWIGQDNNDALLSDGPGDVLYETNELGAQGRRVATLPPGIKSFVQLNGTLYYLTPAQQDEIAGQLRCSNIMNPELNCTFNARSALGIAYDWRAGKIYWADQLRDCVLRSSLDASQENMPTQFELLPIFGAKELAIDAERGLLYYNTGRRLLRRTLNGIHETAEEEYFHVNGMGGTIRTFALALEQQKIYWIVLQAEGHVRLFAAGLDGLATQPQLQPFVEHLLDSDVADASLVYLSEVDSLMWLQRNTNRAVLLRIDTPDQRTQLVVPALQRIASVQPKTDYALQRDISVMPMTVDASSLHIAAGGYWDDFQLLWTPIDTSENHTVFYKVVLEYGTGRQRRLYTSETLESRVRITEFHQPQLLLNVSITPHTYWQAGMTTNAQLRTPAAAPTQPKRLRIFVERVQTPLQRAEELQQARALIRWEPPENISLSTPVAYKIYCWRGEQLFAELLHNHSATAEQALEAHVAQLQLGETYTFQVQAFVGGRVTGGEKTAFHALHVDPELQAVPRLLYSTTGHIAELDMDLQSTHVLVHTGSEADQLVVVRGEQRLLWVNENVELMSYVPGASATPVKLARMRAEVLALTVDWVARIVYWAEMATDVPQAVALYKLELCQFEGRVMLGTKLHTTAPGRRLQDLIVLPYAQLLLWLEASVDERYATLMARNMSDATTTALKTEDGLARMFEGDVGSDGAETLLLLDHRGKLCAYDIHRQHCQSLKLHFGIPAVELQDLQRDASFYYALHNGTVNAFARRSLQLAYTMGVWGVRRIRAYNAQPYPSRDCLLPREDQMLDPALALVEQHYILLRLPPLRPVGGTNVCPLPLAGLKYKLSLTDALNHTRHFTVGSSSPQRELNITMLEPFSNYTLQLSANAYYQQKLGQPVLHSAPLLLQTALGVPTIPRNFTARTLSPTEIEVGWQPPTRLNCAHVWYELHWQTDNSTGGAHKALEPTNYTLNDLAPGQRYTIWLRVLCASNKYNTTPSVTATTFAAPEPLQLLERGAYHLNLTWQPSGPLVQAVLVCQAVEGEAIEEYTLDTDALAAVNISAALIVVSDLTPKTRYEFYIRLQYVNVSRPYLWPELTHERITYETLGDRPSAPGRPLVEHITGEIFKVLWEPARNNGAPIAEYQLEALQQHIIRRVRRGVTVAAENRTLGHLLSELAWVEEPKPLEDEWIVCCNTTEVSCIVRDVHTLRLLMFRVRARNEPYGWGPRSPDSERVNEPYVSAEKRDSLILAIIAPAAIVSSFVIVLVVVRVVHQRRVRAKKLLQNSRPSIWSNLSTQQQQQQLMLARHRAFSLASSSMTYGMAPLSDADIALLPHINWSQITLMHFLGSGAFGEVYEGCVKWDDEETPQKVAIKCLRKGANEFSELLQEAQLMSNFQHDNIVRLIGVCFETEAISIIMEHMEGGDLLTYLRESRPIFSRAHNTLQLLDLLGMCIDVVSGCAYLEDMHFVHRDLACRNCLVSSRDPAKRVVKIGDFGLARDIYKNDYYRKEGEGLLPVRWMSPESLMDGVFTIQSDVWAFGVLCWEIFTLGQQPYAARNNFEVLTYVRDDGRLEQPDNCPDKLFELWLECWQENPDQRPTFRKCRHVLMSIKGDLRRSAHVLPQANELDGGDYHAYTNHGCVVLTSFLAGPLPQLTEVDEVDEEAMTIKSPSLMIGDANSKSSTTSSVNSASTLHKPDSKVHFELSDAKDSDYATATDNAELITHIRRLGGKSSNSNKHNTRDAEPKYYVNEGISRL